MIDNYFITTFNKRLYKEYGSRFIETFIETDQLVPLFCYVEESDFSIYPQNKNITYLNLYDESSNLSKFVERFKNREFPPVPKKHTIQDDDALKFSFKVHAQYAAKDIGKRMFYVDFDCVFIKQIPLDWYDSFISQCDFAYYPRKKYTETGFIGFNVEHETVQNFFEKYISLYVDDSLFDLVDGYHDCIAFDSTLQLFPNRTEKTYGNGKSHTMPYCPKLSPYIDHRKGDRKHYLNSPEWLNPNMR